jgi:hypothetical protein
MADPFFKYLWEQRNKQVDASNSCKRACSRCAVFDIGCCFRPCAVRTTEKPTANFDPVSDDPAFAVLADRSQRLDRTFETVEGMPRASGNQFKTLVVFIPANLAYCHISLLDHASKISDETL